MTDDGRVVLVGFWRAVGNSETLNPAVDEFLGYATQGSGTWALNVSTAGFGSGNSRFFAQAIDDEGAAGNVVTATATLGTAAVLDDLGLGYSETGTGWTSATATGDVGGEHRQHAAGSGGDAAAQWTFAGLPDGFYEVGATWSASAALAPDATFNVLSGGNVVATTSVDQQVAPQGFSAQGRSWQELGSFYVSNHDVTVVLSDAAGGAVAADAIYLIDPPSISSVEASPSTLLPGDSLTLTAQGVTTYDSGTTIAGVEFYAQEGYNEQDLGAGTSDGNGNWTLSGISTFAFPPGPVTYTAIATDDQGRTGSYSCNGDVAEPYISGSSSVNGGATYTLSLNSEYASIDHWNVNWGDNTSDTVSGADAYYGVSHVYHAILQPIRVNNQPIHDHATATDSNGGSSNTNTVDVCVTELPPVVTISSALARRGPVILPMVSVSDPENLAPTNWQVFWGDGNTSSGPWSSWPPTHTYPGGGGTYYPSTSRSKTPTEPGGRATQRR